MHPLTVARFFNRLSRRELAERASVGTATVRDIERGIYEPRLSTAKRIAAVLDLPLAALWDEGDLGAERLAVLARSSLARMNPASVTADPGSGRMAVRHEPE